MRVLLFTGKGGVGKTTLAAASAVRLAESGLKVLVVSSDQAHSLADALDTPLGAQPTEVDHGLFGMQLDAHALLQGQWATLRRQLAVVTGTAQSAGIAELEVDELTVLPGVDELLALSEVRRQVEGGLWDVVVLDCGPTAETLRMLTLPEAVSGYIERVWPRHRRLTHSAFGGRAGGRAAQLVDAVERLDESARAVRALLADGQTTAVRLVLTPERVVIAETRRTLTALALHGLRVDGVLANRVLPTVEDAREPLGPAGDWLRTRVTEQAAVLAALHADLPTAGVVRTAPYQAREPVGISELSALAGAVYGAADVLAAHGVPCAYEPEVRLESGTGLAAVYLWRIPLPLVQESSVALGRIEDDLLVTVAGERRRMTLPSVLRRCDAVDAELVADGLLVRFRPNPAVWMR